LCGYDKDKQPCASAADEELIKSVQTQLRDEYDQYNPNDIQFIIDRHHREKIVSIKTPDWLCKTVGDWETWAVNEFWKSVSDDSDYEKQTQSLKKSGKPRVNLVTIKTAKGYVETKPAWVWEKEVADKQRGKKIVTIQTASGAQSLPVWRWEEDAKTVFWRAVHGKNSSLSHMAVFSQGFPWQPPASWKI